MAKAELVLVGTDDGVVLLSNPGGIGRWLKSAHALRGHAIMATWAHPNDPTRMLCSNTDYLWMSTDGGQTWEHSDGPASVRMVASRATPDRIWAHDGQTAHLSHDAGQTWHRIASADSIAGGGDLIWYRDVSHGQRSTNGGIDWEHTPAWQHVVISHDGAHLWHYLDDTLGYAHTPVQQTPADFVPMVACAGSARIVGITPTGVWTYADTWEHIETLTNQSITAMQTTIYHPDRAWAGDAHGNLWYSGDRCLSWELIRGGFSTIRSIATARLL